MNNLCVQYHMKPVILILFVVVVTLLPVWPYSQGWGYSSIGWVLLLGVVLVSLRKLRVI